MHRLTVNPFTHVHTVLTVSHVSGCCTATVRRMEATAPLWLGVLLAVLAPVSALGAAVWTQRAADRRANRDADRRDTVEQLTLYAQQRRECYVQLLVTASACSSEDVLQGDHPRLLST